MRTNFTPEQLADPAMAASEKAIRTCVHCGFCTATCPTYVLLGDERDSPRGRIYLMQQMLERNETPTREVVTHIDRCLSCLGCETTCPSGVSYRRLIDHARAHVHAAYRRPVLDRGLRWVLAQVLPYRRRFGLALGLGRLVSPLAGLMDALGARRVGALLRMAGAGQRGVVSADAPVVAAVRKGRVILPMGCVEPVLRPNYQAAVERLLARAGYEVLRANGEGCCGSLTHHLGREVEALGFVRKAVDAWSAIIETEKVHAIIVTASGCGTTIKDYGFLVQGDPAYAEKAARIASLAKDISEFLKPGDLPPVTLKRKLRVAWQAPCSLQHGQKIGDHPKALLEKAGFEVVTPANAHLCCGSAGMYSILEPKIADELGRRKAASLDALKPDVIATANIGCALHVGARTGVPVVHIAELLDWATGGPAPVGLDGLDKAVLGTRA